MQKKTYVFLIGGEDVSDYILGRISGIIDIISERSCIIKCIDYKDNKLNLFTARATKEQYERIVGILESEYLNLALNITLSCYVVCENGKFKEL